MKKLLIVLLGMLFLCLLGCANNEDISVWVWDEDDAVGIRVGTFLTENNEAGGSIKWRDDDSGPRVVGLYTVHHWSDLVEFRNPFIVDFLPETIFGSAYLGGKMDYDLDEHDGEIDPIAGVIFEDTLYLEHSLNGDSMIGLRFKF